MPNLAALQRDIERAEHNLAQLHIRKQLAELDRKLILLTAVQRIYGSPDLSPPQQT